ncbi:MAG: 3-hydroxyacyl-ACP dehydratase FabZ family protein [Gammaproteobacteria bacterium]
MRAGVAARPVSVARAKLPEVGSRECDGDHARFELTVPATLAWFAGHFPGHSILPGVAQVGWAAHFAREAFGFAAEPLRIDRVKFSNPVCPGDSLDLELRRESASRDRVEWRFVRDGVAVSGGRLDFTAEPLQAA